MTSEEIKALDREHVVYTPTVRDMAGRMEMRVVNFRTGKEDVLLNEPHTELIVAHDGTAVAYCRAASHFAMQLYYLKLRPPSAESVHGLPTPEYQGESQRLPHGLSQFEYRGSSQRSSQGPSR